MNILFETESGLNMTAIEPSYNFNCGPYKLSFRAIMSASDAIQVCRLVGRKGRLSIDGLVVWWGFLADVSCDLFSCSVNDIKNHLLSTDYPTITDEDSIQSHGVLSGSHDDDGTNIGILSKPVLSVDVCRCMYCQVGGPCSRPCRMMKLEKFYLHRT